VINDDTPLQIIMQDYDTTNVNLSNATLEIRRIGQGNSFRAINPTELQLGNYIDRPALAENDRPFPSAMTPFYTFTWNVREGEGSFEDGFYPDGEYELRVVMACNTISSFTYSNVIRGTIARDGLRLLGTPSPSDGLWTSGADEISFSFNKNLDCGIIDVPAFKEDNISVIRESTGEELPFTVGCYSNKIVYALDQPMSDFNGEFLVIKAQNIPSLEGNISEVHEWRFRVITEQLYWNEGDTIKLEMYAGDSFVLNAWISVIEPATSTFTVTPSGRAVNFNIEANQPVGTYLQDVELVTMTPDVPKLHIQLKVLKTPPNWVVDPSGFSMISSAYGWMVRSEVWPISKRQAMYTLHTSLYWGQQKISTVVFH